MEHSARATTPSGSNCRAPFAPTDLGTLATFLHRLPRSYRYAVEVRHPSFFDDERSARQLEQVLGRIGAEWVPFDTVTLFGTPATSYAEREAWMKKPRVLRRSRALTDRPIVRYIGRDDPELTIKGWDYLVRAVVEWLAKIGRRLSSCTRPTTSTR